MNQVNVLKTNKPERIKEILKNPPKNKKVFIKINLSLDRNYPGTTTRPDLLKEVIKILNKHNEVVVGDSNASSCNADKAMQATGITQTVKETGARTINLSKDKKVLVKNEKCIKLKSHWMPESIMNADHVISMALLKTHVFTGITSTLKNMFGSLPDLKILHHQHLNESIHDAVIMTKPQTGIIDGRIGMQGRGPVEGTPVNTGVIITSNNLASCDAEATKIMGFKPENIKHLMLCNKELKGLNYELNGIKKRMKYQPASKGIIDKLQEASFKNKTIMNLCYKTPAFNILKTTAKTIKDIRRYFRT